MHPTKLATARALRALCALLALAACGKGKSSTGPSASFTATGSYEMQSYDGHAVPYVLPVSVAADQQIVSGNIVFQSTTASTGTGKWCQKNAAVSNPALATTFCVDFTWTLSGQTLTWNYTVGDPSTATVSGAFLDLGVLAPDLSRTMTLRFKKRS